MTNATRDCYFGNNDHPMSQGTRVHQMAMYTLFEAPLQMLADSPSAYEREQECTDFIAQVPTTFDETVAIDGQLGEYAVVARRKGTTWYVAAMTDWTPRQLTISLSFLGSGTHKASIFADGVNADKMPPTTANHAHRHRQRPADSTPRPRRRLGGNSEVKGTKNIRARPDPLRNEGPGGLYVLVQTDFF